MDKGGEWTRTKGNEMTLIVLRMLSILVSRWRGSEQKIETSWIARITAETITRAGIIGHCNRLLHVLRPTWKGPQQNSSVQGENEDHPNEGSGAPVSNTTSGSHIVSGEQVFFVGIILGDFWARNT